MPSVGFPPHKPHPTSSVGAVSSPTTTSVPGPVTASNALPPVPRHRAPLPNSDKRTPADIHKEIFGGPPTTLSPAEMDTVIQETLDAEETLPAQAQIKEAIGKTMYPTKFALTHPAAPMLQDWGRRGCPVNCGANWSTTQILHALKRGPHISATSTDAIQALQNETLEKIENGYARLVRWGDIKNDIPPQLKISPVAMVPHKSRKFRTILDLSFALRIPKGVIPSVNETTTKQAPAESMVQLGECIKRIVATMAKNYNPQAPFAFSKIDIKDGFWRLMVSNADAWNFCYVMPSLTPVTTLDDIQIVVPNSLQMGWCESPPFFCAVTETARDIIMDLLSQATTLPDHPFQPIMLERLDALHRFQATSYTVTLLEVFVDDFCAITNNLHPQHLTNFSKAILHGIHSVFPPPSVSKHQGEDPISHKKLLAGDGTWEHTKEILGWVLDGINYTIQLSPSKCQKICALIKTLLRKNSCPLLDFQKVTGNIQHASFAIPGGKGLFAPLWKALISTLSKIHLTPVIKSTLRDWRTLLQHLAQHPTPVQLLVPQLPNYIQYTDACHLGCGGVIGPGTLPLPHLVWQYKWPNDIRQRLHHKKLSINDLELAGLVLGWLILELSVEDLHFKHVGSFCDNTSSVSWCHKGYSSKSIPAARLLRFLSLRQRARKTSSIIPVHIPGKNNTMADICSRAFRSGAYFAAESNLLAYFNSHFPLPQNMSWIERTIPAKLTWRVISCLHGKTLPMASLTRLSKRGKNI